MGRQLTNDEKELFAAILTLSDADECAAFFEDICTIKELEDLSQRWCVAKMLSQGEHKKRALSRDSCLKIKTFGSIFQYNRQDSGSCAEKEKKLQ